MRLFLGLILIAAIAPGYSAALEVGVAQCDITPDVKAHRVPMAGFGARLGRPSKGVHDSLHAKVLYLRDGKTIMAIVTADLRSITADLKTQIIQKAALPEITEENLLVCASHTHSGPSIFKEKFWQMQFGSYDPKIVEIMSASIADSLKQAAASAAPARVGFGEAQAESFTNNRRWEYDTPAREAAGEKPAKNPILSVMRIDDTEGKCRALLVHFATHPTILGSDNMLISADWPGAAQRELESAFPGSIALYANGAEGDQSPAGAKGADGFERVEDFGKRLAAEAEKIARQIKTTPDAPIAFKSIMPNLPEIVFSEGAAKGPNQSMASAAIEALPRKATIQALRVGDLFFVGVPGEAICDVGMEIQKRATIPAGGRVVVLGLANDYIGYIVNEEEYKHGGYEVDSRSYYGLGLGDFIAQAASEAVGDLLKQ